MHSCANVFSTFLTIGFEQLSRFSKGGTHSIDMIRSWHRDLCVVCHFLSLPGSDSPASAASRMKDLDSGERRCRGGCYSNSSSPVCAIWSCLLSSSSRRTSCMETTPDASRPKERCQILIEPDHKRNKNVAFKNTWETQGVNQLLICGV